MVGTQIILTIESSHRFEVSYTGVLHVFHPRQKKSSSLFMAAQHLCCAFYCIRRKLGIFAEQVIHFLCGLLKITLGINQKNVRRKALKI